MTPQEKHLWYDYLRGYPVRFLKQKVVDNYICDFYCSKAKLVIELDGSQHYLDKNKEKEKSRNNNLEKRGLMVLHISNYDITANFDGVCEHIDSVVKERVSALLP